MLEAFCLFFLSFSLFLLYSFILHLVLRLKFFFHLYFLSHCSQSSISLSFSIYFFNSMSFFSLTFSISFLISTSLSLSRFLFVLSHLRRKSFNGESAFESRLKNFTSLDHFHRPVFHETIFGGISSRTFRSRCLLKIIQ